MGWKNGRVQGKNLFLFYSKNRQLSFSKVASICSSTCLNILLDTWVVENWQKLVLSLDPAPVLSWPRSILNLNSHISRLAQRLCFSNRTDGDNSQIRLFGTILYYNKICHKNVYLVIFGQIYLDLKSLYLWQTYYYILMELAENMLIGTLWDVLEAGVWEYNGSWWKL